MKRVGFIGTSAAPSVAQQILARGVCDVATWYPDDIEDVGKAEETAELRELANVPLIVFSAPIEACRPLARRLGDFLTGRHVIVHTVRSLEPGSLKSVSTILREETPTQRVGFVSGPMRPEDLSTERPGAAVCASHFPEVHDLVEEAMVSQYFRLYRSQDLAGAELSSAYGRIIAVMSGLVDGLDLGASLQATLFARGLAEMARFVVFRDGYERTTFGLSGAGNLYADTHGEGSLDFQMGRHLADGNGANSLEEIFGNAAREILALMRAFSRVGSAASLELHLLQGMQAIVDEKVPAHKVVEALMTLPTLYE